MITSLELHNLRLFESVSYEFEPGVTIIIGPNASGKTTVLEALLLACQGSSYRAADGAVVRGGKDWARIEAVQSDDTIRKLTIKVVDEKTEKKFTIQGKEYKRLPARQKIPTVLFEPNQLVRLTSSPELRRSLLDDLLQQIDPEFSHNRKAYLRALSQRNNLLKDPAQARKQIFAWNVRLSEYGAQVVKSRRALLSLINEKISELYSELAGKHHTLQLEYESRISPENYGAGLLRALEANLEKDITRGFTGYGPHRDDIVFYLNNASLKDTGSRGEVRTTLLAMKVVEAQLLSEKTGKDPILLLDDVLGELDGYRRKTLAKLLNNYQTFITTTDADIVKRQFASANLMAIA